MLLVYFFMNFIYDITDNNVLLDLVIALLIIIFLFSYIRFKKPVDLFDSNFGSFSFFKKYWIILFVLLIGALLQFISVLSCDISPHEYGIFMQYAFNNSTGGIMENKFFNVVDSLIFAPIFEETIFRFILMNFLKLRFNNINYCVFISGFYFGVFHVLSFINYANFGVLMTNYMFWIYFIIKIVFGCYFAFAYSKTVNIYINIFLHSFTNLVVLLT
ncbi:CPBP family intramembrane metalloprotease [Apilactobacillus kunkeei]|uniref:CPBP family intramembrane glutamic endopeptidase n=1 Tax=Apilactobacillus kunkeei TaxID=148814 RepID=UPI00200B82C9|nr:type II CAAX endopeptidase family protein [Apilactobacillus kunkeei]MCK8620764.1 CPBP family intramembrane metalloprotease [Apilactobacillus kunkeei]